MIRIVRRVISVEPLQFGKNHVTLRCGCILVLFFKQIPASRLIRCWACETYAEGFKRPGVTDAQAVARADQLTRIPHAERGRFHLQPAPRF
jgi:hypothetical protein